MREEKGGKSIKKFLAKSGRGKTLAEGNLVWLRNKWGKKV